MHYGNPPHKNTPDDVTIWRCRCGWVSKPIPVKEQSFPMWCEQCDQKATFFTRMNPDEAKRFQRGELIPR